MTVHTCNYCKNKTQSFRLHVEHLAEYHWEIISSKKKLKKRKRTYIQGQIAFTGDDNSVCKYCNGSGIKKLIQCWKDKDTGEYIYVNTGKTKVCSHCS